MSSAFRGRRRKRPTGAKARHAGFGESTFGADDRCPRFGRAAFELVSQPDAARVQSALLDVGVKADGKRPFGGRQGFARGELVGEDYDVIATYEAGGGFRFVISKKVREPPKPGEP